MPLLKRQPLNAERIYEGVVTDETYEVERSTRGKDRAFAVVANALVEMGTYDSGHRTRCADQLHVAATIGDYIRSQRLLDSGMRTSPEAPALKADIVTFNHALQQMIDGDPGASFDEVLTFLTDMAAAVNKDNDTAQTRGMLKPTLIGMANELIGEQLASHIGIEVEDATAEEDLRGTDRYFTIDNRRWPVDLKLTQRRADESRAKDWHGDTLILSTPITTKDIYTHGFRLPAPLLEELADEFRDEVASEVARCTNYSR